MRYLLVGLSLVMVPAVAGTVGNAVFTPLDRRKHGGRVDEPARLFAGGAERMKAIAYATVYAGVVDGVM